MLAEVEHLADLAAFHLGQLGNIQLQQCVIGHAREYSVGDAEGKLETFTAIQSSRLDNARAADYFAPVMARPARPLTHAC
jgi:hypothetical protein